MVLPDYCLVKKVEGFPVKGLFHQMSKKHITDLEKRLALPLQEWTGKWINDVSVGCALNITANGTG